MPFAEIATRISPQRSGIQHQIAHARSKRSNWIEKLLERRHYNAVVVALANKMARTVWAVLAKGKAFDLLKWNPLEQVSA